MVQSSKIHNVTLAGGGVLGSQIAMQAAFFGFHVSIYDKQADAARERVQKLVPVYAEFFKKSVADTQALADSIQYHTELAAAVENAQLLIEALPEAIDLKNTFYQELNRIAPAEMIIASNSSTLTPSQMVAAIGRPKQFLALHFANHIWQRNTAEIMGTAQTDPAVFDSVVQFARDIHMIALPLHKEQAGYILNTLLVPFLDAAMHLYANDIADPHTVDKTWMLATGAPMGPFAIMDAVGINTLLNINRQKAQAGSELAAKAITKLQKEFVEQGYMGIETGKGFYDYPNPAFQSPHFLKND